MSEVSQRGLEDLKALIGVLPTLAQLIVETLRLERLRLLAVSEGHPSLAPFR